ncbi:MAG: VWA domain-containing protein [Actinobacteria bacterium]|nr:MAG: VWA domain-containing protein [Actinomycetota bacterium]
MTFERPLLLVTLLLVPLAIALYVLAERRRMRYAIRFTNVDVLAGVVRGRVWRQYVPLVLFLLALAALCVGVARPQRTTLVPKDRATVILVVDVSRSMESKDVKPSRIGAATQAVRLFLKKVPDRLQVGLIAFAGDPAVAAPPTTDHDLVRTALETIQWYPSFGGTAIGDALAEAVRLGQEAVGGGNGNLASVTAAPSKPTRGLVSILFLSDGAQTRGQLLPLEGADRARDAGIPVYTVALGTPNGTLQFGNQRPSQGFPNGFGFGRRVPVPPDPATLHAIADRTGGEFFAAHDAESLKSAYSKLGSRLGRKPGKTEITYGFLAAAAGLLIAAGLLSAAWSPRVP